MTQWSEAFPNLGEGSYETTSPPTPEYNCIAWAAEEDDRWWWPSRHATNAYWPPGLPRAETLENFRSAFRTLGYEPANDDKPEAGFEKVALYADANGTPTHMARQLETGVWTSKLGQAQDIEHVTLQDLEGGVYGYVAQVLKRPKTTNGV